jgi:hypothetical protein
MTTERTSYELLVGRHVSPATLATFPVALVPTAVPRNTMHRLRVAADQDIAEIVRRLTECNVALLEIRCCPAPPREGLPDAQPSAPPEVVEGTAGVVVPFRLADAERPGRSGSSARGGRRVLPFTPPSATGGPQPAAGKRRGPRPNR